MSQAKLRTALALAGLCLTTQLFSAEKIDLSRSEPVAPTAQIPIQDFFRPVVMHQPKLNLAGSHVAALISAGEDKYSLLVTDLKTKSIEVVQGYGDKDVYSFDWLDNNKLMFGVSTEKIYGLGWMITEVGMLSNAYPVFQNCGPMPVSVPRNDRLRPLVWLHYELMDNGSTKDGGVVSVKTELRSKTGLVNSWGAGFDHSMMMDIVENNDSHIHDRFPLPKGGGLGTGYMADKDGQLAFAFTKKEGVSTLHRLVDLEKGKGWEPCPIDTDVIDIQTCGDKPGELVVLGPENTTTPRALQLMDAASGNLGEVILQDKAYDFNGWLYRDPANGVILGAIWDREGPTSTWFHPDYKKLQKTLESFFPGLVVRLMGSDEQGGIFLVGTYSDRQPMTYYSVDLRSTPAQIGLIKRSRPWIDAKRMQPMNIVKYKTRDGKQLDAYVTLPAGASKTNPAPLVVLPHGGPWVRDTWGFNPEAQFLASRGYAVLQPNFRSNPGYGWQFPITDDWEFLKMHEDVTDATRTILKTGLVDPNRVAIMGASFGGYLAISGVVHEPGLYRCAITEVGVFDWDLMVRDAKYNQFDDTRYMTFARWLGDPRKEKEKFERISPINFINRIQVPVLVAHGRDDRNVDVQQSKSLVNQLEKYKIPHEVYLAWGEGHGMHHIDDKVKFYTMVEDFLAKNLGPGLQPKQ